MLKLDVTEPSQTAKATSIYFAPKNHGMLRFFVDYPGLNAVTIRDLYLIPIIEECIDSQGDARRFYYPACQLGVLAC